MTLKEITYDEACFLYDSHIPFYSTRTDKLRNEWHLFTVLSPAELVERTASRKFGVRVDDEED